MIDPKLVKKWDIVFALADKGCGYSATYVGKYWWPRLCGGPLDNVQWSLLTSCPAGCPNPPPPPYAPPTPLSECDPNYNGDPEAVLITIIEGMTDIECSGTCCLCGGVQCEPSETCCDNVCVDLQTDHDHCNSCTTPCGVDQECCPDYPDHSPEEGEVVPSVCRNIYEDSNNCDGCGNVCPEATPICCNGDCCTTANCCFVGDILTCIDVTNNHEHCGGCDNPCAAEETCCSGECVNTQTDNEHCGSCPNACPVAYTCCDGVCKELFGDDRLNCGDCGKTCQVGEICKNGVCKDACAANDCSFTWGEETVTGCCTHWNCIYDGTTYQYTATWSEERSEADCIMPITEFSGDPSIPCNSTPLNMNNNYNTWSEVPCTTGCCKTYTCTENGRVLTSSVAAATAENCAQAPLGPCIDPDTQILDPTMIGNVSKYWFPEPCPPAFHALSTDEDENGTVSALAGAWTATLTCPNTCNCPGNAPIEDGTDGQVVTYECVNCLAPCGAGKKCCSGQCKHILIDVSNCGDCGVNCGSAAGDTCCNGNCVNTLTSELYCGNCDTVCALDLALNIQCCNGVCIPLNVSVNNCGGCGNVCTGINPSCCNGNCCPAENTCCFGTNCVNRNTDNNNCGNCGTVCSPGFSCINGVCLACNPPCLEAGTACCNNSCIDIWSDESNCGSCGYACASGLICCGGVCKNPLNDMFNCGDCGIECPQMINQINLWQCCNGECKNLKTDPENCGICGLTCQEPPGDTFTVPKCFLGNCVEPYCTCEPEGMPEQPGPNDVAFPATCSGNTVNCDGSCYFNAVGGGWVLYEAPGLEQPFASCGQSPDYTYCVDDKYACVDDKYVCVGDIYYCVKPIEGQDMPTYCIPKASFDAETQALIGSYIGAENCAAGCSGDGSECDPNPCPNGLTCCDSQCVDTQTDSANCGGCGGGPCAEGETCKDGVCAGCPSLCASGESCCEGGTTCCKVCCADACCPTGQSCVDGLCATCDDPPCTAGQTCCGGSCCPAGIICCDQTCCAEGEFCENGSCATCNPVPYPDETCCNGTPVRWQCGECPNACASAEIVCCGLPGQEVCCPEGQTCVDNACYGCTPPCSESQDCCDEVCTAVGTDTNCSGCDNACGEGTKCCDKVCTATGTDTNCSDCGDACAEGQSCCDDLCTEIGTDTNCSGCGDACTGGKCCEGVCKETQTDNENCGDCENVCDTPSEKCVAGVCVTCDPPCTGLDVCCDLTCCKVCCGPDLGPKICCAEGKLCNNGQCTGCDPECTEAGSSCCGNPNAPPPTEEEPNPPVGECCAPGDNCCAGRCCGSSTSFCCDNKTCCYGDQVCCDGVCCAPGRYCDNGVCADCNPVCYSDENCCGGTCIRWQCGDCPNACPSAAYRCSNDKCCENGGVGCDEVCCPAGVTCCRGICCPNSTYKCCDGFCEISNNCRDCSGENLCPPEGGTPDQLWQCCDDGVCSNAAQRAGWVDYVCYS